VIHTWSCCPCPGTVLLGRTTFDYRHADCADPEQRETSDRGDGAQKKNPICLYDPGPGAPCR